MAEKPFAVGEDVFDSLGWEWCKIYRICNAPLMAHYAYDIKRPDGVIVERKPHQIFRDPHSEIPHKPKRVVTKEAVRGECHPTFFAGFPDAQHFEFAVPRNAKFIRCLYDIEE